MHNPNLPPANNHHSAPSHVHNELSFEDFTAMSPFLDPLQHLAASSNPYNAASQLAASSAAAAAAAASNGERSERKVQK